MGAESPAAWHADPTGRHQYRYWDGASWTEQVADEGKSATDPLDSGPLRPPDAVAPGIETVKKGPGLLERHRQKKAVAKYQAALAAWQQERDGQAALLELAHGHTGEPTTELMLKKGEMVFAKITGTGLIEMRKGGGHWEGRSQGVSVPIGSLGGRSIRYRVGTSKGHYVQATPHPTAIDTGTAFITNQRVIFKGQSQTRECLFSKLLGCEHAAGATTFSVSNRQKPTTIHYGSQLDGWVELRLEIALAHYRGEVPALVERLTQGLGAIDAEKPKPPSSDS